MRQVLTVCDLPKGLCASNTAYLSPQDYAAIFSHCRDTIELFPYFGDGTPSSGSYLRLSAHLWVASSHPCVKPGTVALDDCQKASALVVRGDPVSVEAAPDLSLLSSVSFAPMTTPVPDDPLSLLFGQPLCPGQQLKVSRDGTVFCFRVDKCHPAGSRVSPSTIIL